MDAYLSAVRSQVRLGLAALAGRKTHLESQTSKLSRHYSKLKHTSLLIAMLTEIQAVVDDDPELWDVEEEAQPW